MEPIHGMALKIREAFPWCRWLLCSGLGAVLDARFVLTADGWVGPCLIPHPSLIPATVSAFRISRRPRSVRLRALPGLSEHLRQPIRSRLGVASGRGTPQAWPRGDLARNRRYLCPKTETPPLSRLSHQVPENLLEALGLVELLIEDLACSVSRASPHMERQTSSEGHPLLRREVSRLRRGDGGVGVT